MNRDGIIKHINKMYKVKPEYLFDDAYDKKTATAVFRRKSSNKWFGIIMNINFHYSWEPVEVKLWRL